MLSTKNTGEDNTPARTFTIAVLKSWLENSLHLV